MATNLRAYRDGNRLVLVIENPTKDLESIVGALISGEVNPVKDLTEPKPMAKPKVDVDKMQEVAPKPEVSPIATVATPVNQEHKKAPFVKKLEEQQAAAKADAERPVTTPVKQQAPTTAVKPQPTAKQPNAGATTAPDRSTLIKKVWGMRANAKVKALLKAKYQDENYDIRRLSTAELTYLSKL